MADYRTELTDLTHQIAMEAITKQQHSWGFEGTAEKGFTLREDERRRRVLRDDDVTWPPATGPCADVTFRGQTVNPWREVYDPWIRSIAEKFEDFGHFPDPDAFDDTLQILDRVATDLAVSGSVDQYGSFVPGDGGLSGDIAAVQLGLSGGYSGLMVGRFVQHYGPGKMVTTFGNQLQVALVLGYAVTAEKKVWQGAQSDVLTIARDGLAAMRYEAPSGVGEIAFTVFNALAGLAGQFAPQAAAKAVEGAAKVALSASSIVDQVWKDAQAAQAPTHAPPLAGDDYLAVDNNIKAALEALRKRLTATESGVRTMCDTSFQNMVKDGDGSVYHIDGEAGLSQEYLDTHAISGDLRGLRDIGTVYMPDVASDVTRAADLALDADQAGAWWRRQGLGDPGALPSFQRLLYKFHMIVASSGAELLRAGELLATGAGYLGDADQAAMAEIDRRDADYNAKHGTDVDSREGIEEGERGGLGMTTPTPQNPLAPRAE